MNPDQALAIAQAHRQELRRHADTARLAAELPTSHRVPRVHVTLPRIELGRRVASVRARLAHA
jgi:hypothetical protein